MNYGNIKLVDISNGDGVRTSLFVSGCRNHCPGCFSPDTWNFAFGKEFTPIEANEIIENCKKSYITGLTILGGDPFEEENQVALLPFIEEYKKECPEKTLWMYTGYILDKNLKPGQNKFVEGVTDKILGYVDTLVDGPFVMAEKDISLKYRGSRNQRLLTRDKIAELLKD